MGLYFRLTRHNPARSFRLTERRRDPSEPSSRNHIPDHPIGGQGQIRQSCDERTRKCCHETWLSLGAIATLINGTSMGWIILPCRYMCGNFEHALLKDAGTSEIIPINFKRNPVVTCRPLHIDLAAENDFGRTAANGEIVNRPMVGGNPICQTTLGGPHSDVLHHEWGKRKDPAWGIWAAVLG